MKADNNQIKRWILPKPINNDKIDNIKLNYTLQKVLIRRGIDLINELEEYLTPSELPDPEEHFSEFSKATQRIIQACKRNEKIAVCGDYDADGITSTVLLVELLSIFGAIVNPYIPSRQEEGYGLNINMLNEINNNHNVVVNCQAGISRSATVVIGYIMHTQRLSYDQAYNIVKKGDRSLIQIKDL